MTERARPVYYDSHMHTPLCKHAQGEPEEYAEMAVRRGLKGIIFTCHSPMPDNWWPNVRMSPEQLDEYIGLVERAREAYAGRLDVRLGMESDFFPGYEWWIERLNERCDCGAFLPKLQRSGWCAVWFAEQPVALRANHSKSSQSSRLPTRSRIRVHKNNREFCIKHNGRNVMSKTTTVSELLLEG